MLLVVVEFLDNNKYVANKATVAGFSRTTVELLARHNTQYSTFDILTDEPVRQGLKIYSDFPTYPQVGRPLSK